MMTLLIHPLAQPVRGDDREDDYRDPVQCDPCQAADHTAPGDLGRDSRQEFPHGLLLEHVCRCAVHAVAVQDAVPQKMI